MRILPREGEIGKTTCFREHSAKLRELNGAGLLEEQLDGKYRLTAAGAERISAN